VVPTTTTTTTTTTTETPTTPVIIPFVPTAEAPYGLDPYGNIIGSNDPNLDLTSYYNYNENKLTIPRDYDNNGSPDEIFPPDLASYSSEWRQLVTYNGRSCDKLVVDDGGVSTSGSSFFRTEYRGLVEFSHTDVKVDVSRFYVPVMPVGTKMVVHQIHDKPQPWTKVLVENKGTAGYSVRALTKFGDVGGDQPSITLASGLSEGELVTSWIMYNGLTNTLTNIVNGNAHDFAVDFKGAGGKAYFKKGAYSQDNDNSGDVYTVYHVIK